jgi:hypothetical protein
MLLESMLGLLLLTAITSICLPYVYVLHQEQKTTEQLMYAFEEAERISVNKVQVIDKEWNQNGTKYSLLNKKGVTDEYAFCIQFEASNEKEYEACASYY